MKIIILSTCYPTKNSPNLGIFIHQQVKALQSLGVECNVLQPVNWFPPFGLHRFHRIWEKGYKELQSMFSEFEGVQIYHPRIFRKMPSRFFPEDPWERMGKDIAKYIRRNLKLCDSDLVYAHFLCYEGYASVVTKRKLNIPVIAIARGDDVHDWPEKIPALQKNLKAVYQEADLLLSNSKRLGEDTRKWMSAENIREVFTVYNGVDYNKFFPLKNQKEKINIRKQFNLSLQKKYLLCVATPIIIKGWLNLFDAIQEIEVLFENWKLLAIAPEIKYKEAINLKAEIHKRNLQNKIELWGRIKPEDMTLLMRCSDAFVIPSYNEGMSNALLEAMASGLPVIATDVGGHSEVITDHQEGILIPPKDTEKLKKAIIEIISKEDLRESLGKAARNRMILLGNYKQNAEKLYNLFSEILKKNDPK